MSGASLAECVGSHDHAGRSYALGGFKDEQILYCWPLWARRAQLPPDGEWRTWLMMTGRGFGKTRAGAEWVRRLAAADGSRRIALVGATASDTRAVMVEGKSGILRVGPESQRPQWEPTLGRLRFPSGAEAYVYSGENPDKLRGPEHDAAWCDELAKWACVEETWHNLKLGLRLGDEQRTLVTTTPRPIPLLRRLLADPAVVKSRGLTEENRALPPGFVADMIEAYGGTRLGRQELDGELIEDVEGSLWPRDLIERCRMGMPLSPDPSPASGRGEYVRVVIGVDPPAGERGDACGIVACGLALDGVGYVLGDHSVAGQRPEGWARAVAAAAARWQADRVVAEANQGGSMVASVLRAADVTLPVRLVHARNGKSARAEPVAALFERGVAKIVGAHSDLEDQMAGMTIRGGYEGPGKSPDRADAMVWAMTELMLGRKDVPRVRLL